MKQILRTDNGTIINDYVDNGDTTIFDNQLKAKEYAKQKRSYAYQVYCNGQTTEKYAVPK